MNTIINATQHNATKEQIEAGVVDMDGLELIEVRKMLTFDSIPTTQEMFERAERIKEMIASYVFTHWLSQYVMIGGAVFFMPILEEVLRHDGWKPVYAFSKRVSVEQTLPDGTVQKVNQFKHLGFVGMD